MAKTMTISVPEDLLEKVRNSEIKASATCQAALYKELNDLKAKNLAVENLLDHAEMRLRKELEKDWEKYEKDCYEAGQEWAAREASFEELEANDAMANTVIFNGLGFLPSHIYERDSENDNELFWHFQDGVEDMWKKIKERLERKGYEF